MKNYNTIILTSFVVGCGVFVAYIFINQYDAKKNGAKIFFDGTITSIETNVKREPSVVIKKKHYNLPFATSGELKIGDSMVKVKNNYDVFQFRKGKLIDVFTW